MAKEIYATEFHRIYKYPLALTDVQEVMLPALAPVLHVAVQRGVICLWVCVHTKATVKPRLIHIIGTGSPMPTVPLTPLGTVLMGDFVWHVFQQD